MDVNSMCLYKKKKGKKPKKKKLTTDHIPKKHKQHMVDNMSKEEDIEERTEKFTGLGKIFFKKGEV